MFYFYSFKIFKKSFYQYLISVCLLCILAGIFIFILLINSESQKFKLKVDTLFNVTEQEIHNCVTSIDSYINNLYSNQYLLNDFKNFFSNDIENYLTSRLYDFNINYTNSFPRDLKTFVSDNNFHIKQITFLKNDNINVIKYSENGIAEYLFNTTQTQANFRKNDNYFAYSYTKTIFSNSELNKTLGEMVFVIDVSSIIKENIQESKNNVSVVNNDKVVSLSGNGLISENKAIDIFNNNDSSIHKQSTYFFTNTSLNHSYKLIGAITTLDILMNNPLIFVLSLFILIGTWALIMIIIVAKLNADAHSFDNIMNFIKLAENGNFQNISWKSKKDEYEEISIQLNKMGKKINEYIQKEYILTRKQQQSIMLALQNQINPHFLYNTLEIIRSRALKNNDLEVSNAIENLGSLYRDIVKGDSNITIEEELKLLNKYLDLMYFRYPNSFTYQIDIDENIKKINTIKCWMQPVVENYFKYGFNKESEYNLLFIDGVIENNTVTITFFNNGKQFDEEKLSEFNDIFSSDPLTETNSIGLKNVYSRLKLFYGDSFVMKISNEDEGGVSLIFQFDLI